MQVYWLQENIKSAYWVIVIFLIVAIGTLVVYFHEVKWARFYGSNKIDVIIEGSPFVISLKNYQRLTFVEVCVCVCVCVLIYSQFIGIRFSEKGVSFIYLKPLPERTVVFQELAEYEIRNSQLVFYSRKGRRYLSLDINSSLMEEIVTKIKHRAHWIEERPMAEWRKTKWGKYF